MIVLTNTYFKNNQKEKLNILDKRVLIMLGINLIINRVELVYRYAVEKCIVGHICEKSSDYFEIYVIKDLDKIKTCYIKFSS